MDPVPKTVVQLGEEGLLRRIEERLARVAGVPKIVGDDTAVLEAPGDALLLTTDMLVESVDFNLAYCSGRDIGWKAVAVNASDIAAMGGTPLHAVVALGLPRDTSIDLFDGLLEGLIEACGRWSITLAGGDLSEARELSVSVSMTGTARAPVMRSGAEPGHLLWVTGTLGGAAAGLRALMDDNLDRDGAAKAAVERQLRPVARVAEGRAAAQLGASAMIDLSDGLAIDLARLMEAGGTGCRIDPAAIPVDRAVLPLVERDEEAFDLAVSGGEDFELLFTAPAERAAAIRRGLAGVGAGATEIGTVGDGGCFIGDQPLDRWKEGSWEHLRSR